MIRSCDKGIEVSLCGSTFVIIARCLRGLKVPQPGFISIIGAQKAEQSVEFRCFCHVSSPDLTWFCDIDRNLKKPALLGIQISGIGFTVCSASHQSVPASCGCVSLI